MQDLGHGVQHLHCVRCKTFGRHYVRDFPCKDQAGHNPGEEQNARCPIRGLTLKALGPLGLKVHVRSEAWESGFESGYLNGDF